jgi:hypothetical protein
MHRKWGKLELEIYQCTGYCHISRIAQRLCKFGIEVTFGNKPIWVF